MGLRSSEKPLSESFQHSSDNDELYASDEETVKSSSSALENCNQGDALDTSGDSGRFTWSISSRTIPKIPKTCLTRRDSFDGMTQCQKNLTQTKNHVTSLLRDIQRLTRLPDCTASAARLPMSEAQMAQVRQGVGTLSNLVSLDQCVNNCSSEAAIQKLQRLNDKLRLEVSQLHTETESVFYDEKYSTKYLDRLLNEAQLLVKHNSE